MEGAPLEREAVSQAECDQWYPPLPPTPQPESQPTPEPTPLCFCGFPEACMVVPQVECKWDGDCAAVGGCESGRLFCSPDGNTDVEGAPLEREAVSQAECDQWYPPPPTPQPTPLPTPEPTPQ